MAEKFVRMSLSESACTLSRSWTSRLLLCLVWLGSVASQISGNIGYYLHETTYNAAGPATVVTNHLFTNSTLDKGVMVVLTDGKVTVNKVTSSAPGDITTASADEIRANANICGVDTTCVPGTGIGTYDALLFIGRFSTLQEPAVWMYNIETNLFTQFPDPTPQFGSLRFIIFVPGYSNPNKVLLPGGSPGMEGVSLWDFFTTLPFPMPASTLVESSTDNILYLSGTCTGGSYCYLHSRDVSNSNNHVYLVQPFSLTTAPPSSIISQSYASGMERFHMVQLPALSGLLILNGADPLKIYSISAGTSATLLGSVSLPGVSGVQSLCTTAAECLIYTYEFDKLTRWKLTISPVLMVRLDKAISLFPMYQSDVKMQVLTDGTLVSISQAVSLRLNLFLGVNCHSSCLSCVWAGAHNCTTCSDGAAALNLTYGCQLSGCDAECSTCYGNQIDHCLSCNSGKYLPHQKGIITSSPYECLGCNPACISCNGPTDRDCLICQSGHPLAMAGNSCGTCPTTSGYGVIGGVCFECNPTCESCSGSINNCTACKTPTTMKLVYNAGCTLLASHPTLCDIAASSTTCLKCSSGYAVRDTDGTCMSCSIDGWAAYTKVDTWAADPTHAIPRCAKCGPLCKTCDALTPNVCITCYPGSYLYTDSNTCAPGCITNQGYYVWVDGLVNKCSPCSLECENCVQSSTKCTSCTKGAQIITSNSTCQFCELSNMLKIPPSLTIKRPYCDVCGPRCSSCLGTPTTCTGCFYGYRLDSVTKTCQICSNITFANTKVVPAVCSPCSTSCTTCFGTATNCTSCMAPLMISSENSCVPGSPFNLTAQSYTFATLPSPKPDIALQLTLDTRADYLPLFTPEVYSMLASLVDIKVLVIRNSTNTPELLTVRRSLGYIGDRIYSLFVYIEGSLSERSYLVNFSVPEQQNITLNSSYWVLSPFNYSTEYQFQGDPSAIKGAADQGALAANIMGTIPIQNQAAADIATVLISADPTGVSTRFSQALKATSKMLYINLIYGRKLTSFLNSTEVFASTIRENPLILVKRTTAYRARLSEKKILLELSVSNLQWKLCLYMSSSLLSILFWALVECQAIRAVWLLQVSYYQPKLHLVIYNMVFVDFYFYGTRTALHSKDWFERTLALVCLQMLLLDFAKYLLIIFNEPVWRTMYRRNIEVEQALEKAVAALKVEKSTNSNNDSTFVKDLDPDKQSPEGTPMNQDSNQQPPQVEKNRDASTTQSTKNVEPSAHKPADAGKVIDYDATFREISIRVHIMEVMTAPLTISEEVYGSKLCRMTFLGHNIRLGLYQAIVVGGQYATRLTLISLLLLELSKIASSIYLYVTFKHLRKLIILFMELSQSMFFSAFLVIALIICPAETNDDVPDNLQTSGMWTVIISCMSEYLLLIIYIVITVHDMLRLRKARKTLPKRTSSIIKYRYEKIIPIVSNEEIFRDDTAEMRLAIEAKRRSKAQKLIQGNGFSVEQKLLLAQSLQMNMQQNSLSKVKTILNRLKHTPGDGGRSDEMETQQVSNPQIQRNNQLSNAQTGGYANLWEQMAGETLTIPGLNSKPKKPRKQLDQNYRIKIRTPGMKVAPLDKTSSNKVTITISTAKNGRHVRKFKAAQEPESSPAQQPDKRSKKADKSKHL